MTNARLAMMTGWVLGLLVAAGALGQSVDRQAEALVDRLETAIVEEKFDRAVELARRVVEMRPNAAYDRYNLACALALAGDADEAVEALLDALARGFTEFAHMTRDPNLDPIRAHPKFRQIVDNWALLLDKRAEAERIAAAEVFGERYSSFEDDELRVWYLAALEPGLFEAARAEVERVAAWGRRLFAEPAPEPGRPDPWVQILLPTTEDFAALTPSPTVGGFYVPSQKRLVSRDLGPSLRHEFVHVLHWRQMNRLGQTHPIWIQEGFASLLEDVGRSGAGDAVEVLPSWRTNIALLMAERGQVMRMERFVRLERRHFVGSRSQSSYAQARAVMMFLHERGELEAWYDAYVEGFHEDESGLAALERVTGMTVRDFDQAFRLWLLDVERVGAIGQDDAITLGIALRDDAGGPMVHQSVVSFPEGAGGFGGDKLQYKDTIRAVEGRPVRTVDELFRLLGGYRAGDVVSLTVDRYGTELKIEARLFEQEAIDDGARGLGTLPTPPALRSLSSPWPTRAPTRRR